MSNRIVAPATGDGDASSTTIAPIGTRPSSPWTGIDDRHVGCGERVWALGIRDRVDGAGVEKPIDEYRSCNCLAPLDLLDDSDAAGGEPEQLQR